jgi:hypothetical protein
VLTGGRGLEPYLNLPPYLVLSREWLGLLACGLGLVVGPFTHFMTVLVSLARTASG